MQAARRKLVRLLKEQASSGALPSSESAKAPETVDGYAQNWIEARRKRGIASVEYEERFYARVWSPAIGMKALGAVTAADVRGVLEAAATGELRPEKRKYAKTEPEPYSRQSIVHMRATIFRLPETARPFIKAWWEHQGSPETGPVFPVRRGKRAGEVKKRSNMSYADRLRRELLKAGVSRHELHHETPTTLPVDFHSTRRAYAQTLARIGMNAQGAAELTGHSDLDTHQRYLANVKVRVLPAAAVPLLPSVVTLFAANQENRPKLGTEPGEGGGLPAQGDHLQALGIAVGSDVQAGQAQLVEHELPMLGVTSSSLVSRSIRRSRQTFHSRGLEGAFVSTFRVNERGEGAETQLDVRIWGAGSSLVSRSVRRSRRTLPQGSSGSSHLVVGAKSLVSRRKRLAPQAVVCEALVTVSSGGLDSHRWLPSARPSRRVDPSQGAKRHKPHSMA